MGTAGKDGSLSDDTLAPDHALLAVGVNDFPFAREQLRGVIRFIPDEDRVREQESPVLG